MGISCKQCWNLYFKKIINQMSKIPRNCIAIHALIYSMSCILCAFVLLLKLLIFYRNSTKLSLSLYITHMIMQHLLNWNAIWFLLIKTKWETWKIFQTALVDYLAGLIQMIINIFREIPFMHSNCTSKFVNYFKNKCTRFEYTVELSILLLFSIYPCGLLSWLALYSVKFTQ